MTKSKEKYFVLWTTDYGLDDFEATAYNTLKEAQEAAEASLVASCNADEVYFVAKAVEKLYYNKENEKL